MEKKSRISKLILIAKDDCSDFFYYLEWIKAIKPIDGGILILYNVDCNDCKLLNEIRELGIEPFFFNPPKSEDNAGASSKRISLNFDLLSSVDIAEDKLNSLNFDLLSSVDNIVSNWEISNGPTNEIYIANPDNYQFNLLERDCNFGELLRRHGLKAKFGRQKDLVEGGDFLRIDGHIFFGTRTLNEFGGGSPKKAEKAITSKYGISKDIKLHFFESIDPSLFYHLDLYFTYGGQNKHGVHQFFVGEISNKADPKYHKALHDFAKKELSTVLNRIYGSNYHLTKVPIGWCKLQRSNAFLASPLNGLLDYDGTGKSIYYLPQPDYDVLGNINGVNVKDIKSILEKSYKKILKCMDNDTKRVIRINVPVANLIFVSSAGPPILTRGGQSLHCTIAIIRKEHH